jgi:lipopolysaccharide transport system ATP-binding protein
MSGFETGVLQIHLMQGTPEDPNDPAADIVGIIGGNGAGKSTLLKVLSRITEPTSGEARIRGRVASLLEVGTGFHPELSGRENIFLNGTILGMSKGEVKAKFDEIVDFSGIEKFIDTPVKRYSSGMYVRLAFAVAAHLDPEIMIVDEVLAVGDSDFQKKCLGKMKSIHESGRTVLFVSHQLNMLTSLCTRGIVLKQGSVTFDGTADEAVLHYHGKNRSAGTAILDVEAMGRDIGGDAVRVHRAWLARSDGTLSSTFSLADPIAIHVEFTVVRPAGKTLFPSIHIRNQAGDNVFTTIPTVADLHVDINSVGRWETRCLIPGHLMNVGTFGIDILVVAINPALQVPFHEPEALAFQVYEPMDEQADRARNGFANEWGGMIRPTCAWTAAPAASDR